MMDKEEKKKGERESEKGGHVPQGMSRKTHIHQQTCGELTDPNFLLIKTTCQELCSEVEVNADAKKKKQPSPKKRSPRKKKINDWRSTHGRVFHLVVHLLGAVEDVHHDAERSAQVLGGLGFPRACRTSWGSAHGQMEGLGQCDVASVTVTHTSMSTQYPFGKFK